MTLIFITGLFSFVLLVKVLSLLFEPLKCSEEFWPRIFLPIMTIDTWRKSHPMSRERIRACLRDIVAYLLFAFIYGGMLLHFKNFFTGHHIFLGYLSVPLVVSAGLAFGPIGQLLGIPFGRVIGRVHNGIFTATSLQRFWGQNWNTWTSDAFRSFIFRRIKNPGIAALAVFLFSGLLHEVLIDVPYDLLFDGHTSGMMMIYFFLQYVGVVIDRKIFLGRPMISHIWMWCVLLLPSPFFCNDAVLAILNLS